MILQRIEIGYRLGGPGTEVSIDSPTPGLLAITARHLGTCIPTVDGEILPVLLSVPTAEAILDLNPVVSVVRTSWEVEDSDSDWEAQTETVFAVFGGRWNSTPGMLLEKLEERQGMYDPEFGEGFNFDALEALDLSRYPAVVERYRDNYFRLFETHEGITSPITEVTALGWSSSIIDRLFDAIQEPETEPIHALERWYWHAISTLAVPPLQAYVQGQ